MFWIADQREELLIALVALQRVYDTVFFKQMIWSSQT